MQVTVLGSGCALPTRRRAPAGHLVEWSGHALLLDASAGTYTRALFAGLDPYRLRAVAFTHFHPDHTADLPAILFARRQMDPSPGPLRLLGPAGLADLVERFRAVYGGWLDTPLEAGTYPAELDGLFFEAHPARHSPEALCLRLTAQGKTLAYSGDSADCPGLRAACRDADLALLECSSNAPLEGHLAPADCEAVVASVRPKRTLLVHLPDEPLLTALPLAEDGLVVPL